jgi:sporulation protein YlmC with PRC-barrel domain
LTKQEGDANPGIDPMTSRSILLASAAALLLLSQGASAQSGNPPNSNVRSDIKDTLGKAGYTDIRVMPSSFIIRAKDKSGDPVLMTISPDSFTQVTAMESSDVNTSASAPSAGKPGSMFVSIPNGDQLSSNLVGLDVYNKDNKDIGTIKDIALNPRGRTQSYILSVGGFLGVGEHYVAVNPAAVNVSYDSSAKKWHASMNATADQLKSAPEFKYAGRFAASHS